MLWLSSPSLPEYLLVISSLHFSGATARELTTIELNQVDWQSITETFAPQRLSMSRGVVTDHVVTFSPSLPLQTG